MSGHAASGPSCPASCPTGSHGRVRSTSAGTSWVARRRPHLLMPCCGNGSDDESSLLMPLKGTCQEEAETSPRSLKYGERPVVSQASPTRMTAAARRAIRHRDCTPATSSGVPNSVSVSDSARRCKLLLKSVAYPSARTNQLSRAPVSAPNRHGVFRRVRLLRVSPAARLT